MTNQIDFHSDSDSETPRPDGEALLDHAIGAMCAVEPSPEVTAEAAERVWQVLAVAAAAQADATAARLSAIGESVTADPSSRGVDAAGQAKVLPSSILGAGHGLQGCDDFQALIPAHLAGELSAAQSLLLEDHTRECARCRKAMGTAGNATGLSPAARRMPSVAPSGTTVPDGTARTARRAAAAAMSSTAGVRKSPRRRVWAVAAAVLLALGLGGLGAAPGFVPGFGGDVAHAQVVEGALLSVGDATRQDRPMHQLAQGEVIRAGEQLRTSPGGRAVIALADGTRVEMGERAGLVVTKGWRDTTLNVGQGNVIVQSVSASPGKVVVTTDDLRVAAADSIVAIASGTKGSRVSVIEGEAEVGRPDGTTLLRPGEQVSSSPTVERVPISDDVAWSQDAGRYAELLKQLGALEADIAHLPRPGQRTSAVLLDRAPAGTAIYLSLPNLSRTLQDARKLAEQRIAESEVLASWWQTSRGAAAKDEIYPLLDRLTALGSHLGPEIVVAVPLPLPGAGSAKGNLTANAGGPDASPEAETSGAPDASPGPALGAVVLAEVKDEAALRAALAAESATLHQAEPDFTLVDAGSAIAPSQPRAGSGERYEAAYFSLRNGLIAVGLDRDGVAAATAATPSGGGFARSPLHDRLQKAYSLGLDGLIAVDLGQVLAASPDTSLHGPGPADSQGLKDLGLANARFVVTTFRQRGEQFEHHTDIEFNGPRTGLAAWVAAPGPMGALSYLTPDASLVGAFTVQDPAKLLEYMMTASDDTARPGAPESSRPLSDAAQADAIAAVEEVAKTLGGEVAVALDGPILPSPGWKVIAEVNDPLRFNQALGRLAATLDGEVAEVAPIAGHKAYALRIASSPNQKASTPNMHDLAYFVFNEGYLLITPERGLINAALRTKASGLTLERSGRFKALLPTDGHLDMSAFVYQNFSALGNLPVADLAGALARAAADERNGAVTGRGSDRPTSDAGGLKETGRSDGVAPSGGPSVTSSASTAEQAAALSASLKKAPASLSYAYGAADRIVIAGSMDQNPLGIGLASLLGLGSPAHAARLVEELVR